MVVGTDEEKREHSEEEAQDRNRDEEEVLIAVPSTNELYADAINDVANDGDDDVYECELGGEHDERLRFYFFFSTSAPLGAALECKVGERGHQYHGGVRNDRLEHVLVPAGGESKEEAG